MNLKPKLENDFVCLLVKGDAHNEISKPAPHALHNAPPFWFSDSGFSLHMMSVESRLSSINLGEPFHVQMEDKPTVQVAGCESAKLFLKCGNQVKK